MWISDQLIIWITIIIVHEYGHYIWYKKHGIKPTLILRWFGIQIGTKEEYSKIKLSALRQVSLGGILLAMPLVLFVNRPGIYFLMCGMDLFTLYRAKRWQRKWGDITWAEANYKYMKKEVKIAKQDYEMVKSGKW